MQPETIITIDFGDSRGPRQVSYAEVQRIIRQYLEAAKFSLASSVALQLATELPDELWPQLIAAETSHMNQQSGPALRHIDRALQIDPESVACLVVKSRLCVAAGDTEAALRSIDTALALAGGDARLHAVKAELLLDAGEIDRARDSYTRAIALDPRHTESLLGLAQLPGDTFTAELLDKVELAVQSRQLSADDQIKAHFALAYAYDSKGDAARHFQHLHAGNNLKNRTLKYDPNMARQEARRSVEFFSEEFFVRNRGVRGNPVNAIFIVGFPRCGSTLVEQVLSSHPAVTAAGEIFALRQALRNFQQAHRVPSAFPFWLDTQSAEDLAKIADDYVARLPAASMGEFVTDKLLENYMLIGVIHLLFPNARIVHVQRNPIDTCYSCYKRMFNLGSVPYAYSLENLASRYRDYRSIMRHWQQVLPGRVHTVGYEELVERQEAVTRELLDYCGLRWDDACLRFHESLRPVQTNSNVQVRQPMYRDSVDRWRKFETYLGPLLDLADDA